MSNEKKIDEILNMKLELTFEQQNQLNRLAIHQELYTLEKAVAFIVEKVTAELETNEFENLVKIGIARQSCIENDSE